MAIGSIGAGGGLGTWSLRAGSARLHTSTGDSVAPTTGRLPGGKSPAAPSDAAAGPKELNSEQQEQVRELQRIDLSVRQHEQAHVSAGGSFAGAPQFQTQKGPDGKDYAVSGEVPIDVSPVAGNPDATIAKMETIKRAALAPAEPSPQDLRVAQQADQTKAQARQEKQKTATEDSGDAATSEDAAQSRNKGEPKNGEESRASGGGLSVKAAASYRTAGLLAAGPPSRLFAAVV